MEWINHFNIFLACTLFMLFAGVLCDMVLFQLIQAEKVPMTAAIIMIVTAIFLEIYGTSFYTLRCILICHVLLLAGAADIAKHEIPDAFHLLIAIIGLIDFQPMEALYGLLIVPLPFLIAALKTGKIGGGDVKLMAASGFVLGVSKGFYMIILGLVMALLWNEVMRRGKESIPLAPFLALGCFMALLPVS